MKWTNGEDPYPNYMLQLKPNILNTIYVILNMHLNYNLDIRSSGHFSLQKVSPLYENEGMGSIPM